MPTKITVLLCFLLVAGNLITAKAQVQQEGMISEGKLRVHYQIHGSGAPLVFLHAGFQDLKMWNQQVAYFSRYNKVIALDLPGHGGTKGVDTSLLVQDVLRIFLDSLHIKTASFAGLSIGAACVVDFVLAYPERVEKVILVSPGLSGWAEVLKMDTVSQTCFAKMGRADSTGNFDSIATCFTNVWCVGPGRRPSAVNPYARNYVFRTTLANLQQHPEDNRWPQLAKPPASLRMAQWKKPLLIIVGDEDIPFIVSVSIWMHNTIRDSKRVVISHTAHMLNMERPLDFNQTIQRFLNPEMADPE